MLKNYLQNIFIYLYFLNFCIYILYFCIYILYFYIFYIFIYSIFLYILYFYIFIYSIFLYIYILSKYLHNLLLRPFYNNKLFGHNRKMVQLTMLLYSIQKFLYQIGFQNRNTGVFSVLNSSTRDQCYKYFTSVNYGRSK